MLNTNRLVLLTLAALLAACESAPREATSAATGPGVDLASYKTFGFDEAAFGDVGDPMRFLDQNIRSAIRAQMKARGFEESIEPELLMQYETASQEKVRNASTRFSIGMGSFGSSGGGSVNMSTPSLENYTEGQLIISAVDVAKREEVWQGTLVTDGNSDAASVAGIVATTMESFPGRGAASAPSTPD